MTTLVIGAGLIGSQVARILVERGETLVLTALVFLYLTASIFIYGAELNTVIGKLREERLAAQPA